MYFRQREQAKGKFRETGGIEVLDQDRHAVNGVIANTAIRAFATTGSRLDANGLPSFDPTAIASIIRAISLLEDDSLKEDLSRECESVSTHLGRIAERQALIDNLFDGDLSRLDIVQGRIGTCYFWAPLVSLHQRPMLFSADLTHLFKKVGDDDYDLNFESASGVFSCSDYPSSISIASLHERVKNWKQEFRCSGQVGDVALECGFASLIARGENQGREGQTISADSYGKIPVEEGHSEKACSVLFPDEWVSRYSPLYPPFDIARFGKMVRDPRTILFYDFGNKYINKKVTVGTSTFRSAHAYAIDHGDFTGESVCLRNPHNPKDDMNVKASDLLSVDDCRLRCVSLNYCAAPIMDHARIVKDLPSRQYQIRYMQNLLYACRDRLREFLMLPVDAHNLANACDEFLDDTEFGSLFREVKLKEFVQACERNSELPFKGIAMQSDVGKKDSILSQHGTTLATVALLVAATGIAICTSSREKDDGEKKGSDVVESSCLYSAYGTWRLLAGKDVLATTHEIGSKVDMAVCHGDSKHRRCVSKAVDVYDYPLKCLDMQAPLAVASYEPTRMDYVVVGNNHGEEGAYYFKPDPVDVANYSSSSGLTREVSGVVNGVTVECHGTRRNPVLKGCIANTKEGK